MLNEPLARGRNKSKVFDIFEEAELKLMKANKRRKSKKSATHESPPEEVLEAVEPRSKSRAIEGMREAILLHPACHQKDMQRSKLKTALNAVHKKKFKDLLKIGKCVVA